MIITLKQLEGKPPMKTAQCATFAQADKVFSDWSVDAPKEGGYNKCQFEIVEPLTSFNYVGRVDLRHFSIEKVDLRAQVQGYLKFLAGDEKPPRFASNDAYFAHLRDIFKATPASMAKARKYNQVVEMLP